MNRSMKAAAAALWISMSLVACDEEPGTVPDPAVGTWYETCGDVVCRGNTNPGGLPACKNITAGKACTSLGQQCDFGDACNQMMVCATTNPQAGTCPRSRKSLKSDIQYLSQKDREQLAQQLNSIQLATYRYTAQGPEAPKRLGFMIDDNESSPAVDQERDMVDLYGYLSVAVATLQVQGQQIAQLKSELAHLRSTSSKGKRSARSVR